MTKPTLRIVSLGEAAKALENEVFKYIAFSIAKRKVKVNTRARIEETYSLRIAMEQLKGIIGVDEKAWSLTKFVQEKKA